MIAVDTNVLINAHRSESSQHREALARLTELAESERPWALPVFCLAEFVRVVTHPNVFKPATDLATALEFLDRVLESPSLLLLLPGSAFPTSFRDACVGADARGNLAFDAQIAAVCLEQGVRELLTADRDLARFAGIQTLAI